MIGSTDFWHPESERTCIQIGRLLAGIPGLVLITGGVEGIGEAIGRSFFRRVPNLAEGPVSIASFPSGRRNGTMVRPSSRDRTWRNGVKSWDVSRVSILRSRGGRVRFTKRKSSHRGKGSSSRSADLVAIRPYCILNWIAHRPSTLRPGPYSGLISPQTKQQRKRRSAPYRRAWDRPFDEGSFRKSSSTIRPHCLGVGMSSSITEIQIPWLGTWSSRRMRWPSSWRMTGRCPFR